MSKENTRRPLILEIEDAKSGIAGEINRAISKGVPCYFIKGMLETYLTRITPVAEAEIAAARAQEQSRAKEEAKETEETNVS